MSALAEKSRKELQSRIADVAGELLAATALSPEGARAKERLREKQDLLSGLIEQREREMTDAVAQFASQGDSFVERIGWRAKPETLHPSNDGTSSSRNWQIRAQKSR